MKLVKAEHIAVDANQLIRAIQKDDLYAARYILEEIILRASAMVDELINEGVGSADLNE